MADEEELHASYVSNDDSVLGESVSFLLQSWGLGDLKSKFKSHQIEARALFCLTEKDICELIPKIGRRAIFRSSLMEWRRQNKRFGVTAQRHHKRKDSQENIPIPQEVIKEEQKYSDNESVILISDIADINNEVISVDMNSEESNQCQDRPRSEPIEERHYMVAAPQKNSRNTCQIDVREILNNSYEGKQILTYYQIKGNFDYNHRRRLVTLIINDVIRKKRWLVQDDFTKISRDIIQLFPGEEEATYFIARNGFKNPKGCLYNKFLNLTRKLRQEGVLHYRNNVHLMPERTSTRNNGEARCYRESS